MHRLPSLTTIIGWCLAICLIVWVIKNPATAGNGIQTIFNAVLTFVTSMTN